MDYKRKEYNLIIKPWITKEKSITLFLNTFYKQKLLKSNNPSHSNISLVLLQKKRV